MTTVRITEGDQLVLACDASEIATQNEFIQSLVADAMASTDGTAERDDAEGCTVTCVIESVLTGEQLIDLSVSENRTVTEFPRNEAEFTDLYSYFLNACHDDCDPIEESGQGYSGNESRGLVRFWGTTEDGDNWTVELVNPPN